MLPIHNLSRDRAGYRVEIYSYPTLNIKSGVVSCDQIWLKFLVFGFFLVWFLVFLYRSSSLPWLLGLSQEPQAAAFGSPSDKPANKITVL